MCTNFFIQNRNGPLCSSMASGLITASVRCLGKKKLISRTASSWLSLPCSWLIGWFCTANWALRLASDEHRCQHLQVSLLRLLTFGTFLRNNFSIKCWLLLSGNLRNWPEHDALPVKEDCNSSVLKVLFFQLNWYIYYNLPNSSVRLYAISPKLSYFFIF